MVGSRAGRRAVVVRWRAAGSHQRKIKSGAVGRLISLATECCQLLSSCVWSFHDPRPTVPQSLNSVSLHCLTLADSHHALFSIQPPSTLTDSATKHPFRFSALGLDKALRGLAPRGVHCGAVRCKVLVVVVLVGGVHMGWGSCVLVWVEVQWLLLSDPQNTTRRSHVKQFNS